MFVLKACPRCQGDLYTALDDELTCIQCGKEVGPELRQRLMAGMNAQAPGPRVAQPRPARR